MNFGNITLELAISFVAFVYAVIKGIDSLYDTWKNTV